MLIAFWSLCQLLYQPLCQNFVNRWACVLAIIAIFHAKLSKARQINAKKHARSHKNHKTWQLIIAKACQM
ncbi:hypothetical protein [Moraxella caviae]|uniref:hypothetical protein n=1 Tax=Moraxella caviae TaxID=34060 RepID=UPI00155891D4|nr:hypothetical protein [Moraxella caviae]